MLPFCSPPAILGPDFVEPPVNYESVRVDRLQNGQRISRVEYKHDDGKSNAAYRARDFQLQEIIDAGAFDLLQPVAPLQVSKLASLDSVQRNSAELDLYVQKLSESAQPPYPEDKTSE